MTKVPLRNFFLNSLSYSLKILSFKKTPFSLKKIAKSQQTRDSSLEYRSHYKKTATGHTDQLTISEVALSGIPVSGAVYPP